MLSVTTPPLLITSRPAESVSKVVVPRFILAALRVPVLIFDALKFITLTFAASIVPVVILLPLMLVTLLDIAFSTSPAAKVVNPLGLLEAYAAISALKEAAFVILPSIKDCVTSEDESLEFAVA